MHCHDSQLVTSGCAGPGVGSQICSTENKVTGQHFPAWLWAGGNRLGSTGQALALAWARQTQRGSAADELRAWQAAPYIDAVLTQTRTCWLLRLAAKLHRYQPFIAKGHLQLDMIRKILELFFVILHQAANLEMLLAFGP